jgi:hypothetical protein
MGFIVKGQDKEGQGQVLYLGSRSSAYSEGHRTHMRPEDGVITRQRQDRRKGQIVDERQETVRK